MGLGKKGETEEQHQPRREGNAGVAEHEAPSGEGLVAYLLLSEAENDQFREGCGAEGSDA